MSIKDLKDKYRGHRAFLVGNGPSLSKTPLDDLKQEYCFAMNRISLIYGKTNWRPSFFICTTTNIAELSWRKDIFETISLGIPCFIWDELKSYLDMGDEARKSNINFINCTHGNEVTETPPDDWWSFDISERVCKFGTSMLPAIQIAIYLGFDPIYLVGCDLGFKENGTSFRLYEKLRKKISFLPRAQDKNHFDPSYGTPGFDAFTLNKNMNAAHQLALKSVKKKGVKIYNATVGGHLEIYPRVELQEILG